MNYVKVFDLAETGYTTWFFPSFGLIFVLFGILFIIAPYIFKKLKGKLVGFGNRSYKIYSWIQFGFIIYWTAYAFLSTYSEYKSFKNILINQEYEVVEGKVENYDPMPHRGNKNESFIVNDIKFSYSDYSVTNAFNNTKSHGGPINRNSYVNIYYTSVCNNNYILRLEIKDYKGAIKDYSNGINGLNIFFGK